MASEIHTKTDEQQEPQEKGEKIEFAADITQLMHLIVNSFYSKKEIFLRELLSNSSDALEKIRHNSLTDEAALKSESELRIRVKSDKENGLLVISDTGVGMTRDDLINCLGTIAKSGTKSFLESVATKGVETIGQFGVGFYSSYLVADNVKVVTKHNDDVEYVWESNSDKTFSLYTNETPTLTRGTEIYLYLKADAREYLEQDRIREVIKMYTEFITYPIELWETHEISVEEPIEEETEETEETKETEETDETKDEKEERKSQETDEPKIEDVDEDEQEQKTTDDKPKTRTVKKLESDWKLVNEQKPIWCQSPDDVTEEQYKAFYRNLTKDYSEPLSYKHFHVEGQLECNCILYLPERGQFDLVETKQTNNNIKLYVNKVFIMDDCEQFVPEWLRFIKGVVDSNDIPLNVSREILQQNKIVNQIKNIITKKSIELFTELQEDEDKFNKMWQNYDKMLKLGVHEDTKNREKLVELLRFTSLKDKNKLISLKTYVEEMSEEQKNIYYICGDNKDVLVTSPLLEKIKADKQNVLFFTDAIDQYMVQHLSEYDGKKLVDLSKEVEQIDKDELKKKEQDNKTLINFIKEKLIPKVTEVKITERLQKTPCVLVTSDYGWTANMERIMKAQALRNSQMDQFMSASKIMEINPDHIIMKTLKEKLADESNHKQCADVVHLLYDNSLLNSGFMLPNPTSFASKVNNMIEVGFCDVDPTHIEEEVETPTKSETATEKEIQTPTAIPTEEETQDEGEMEQVD